MARFPRLFWPKQLSPFRARWRRADFPKRQRSLPQLEFLDKRCLPSYTFQTLDVPGAAYPDTEAYGINNSGQIVGIYNESQGFLFSDGQYTTLDVPGSILTWAFGINDSGTIVGNFDPPVQGGSGFLFSGGNYTRIDVPGAMSSAAQGINSFGQIVGDFHSFSNGQHGFLLSDGVYTTLDFPGAYGTGALGINASGQVVGAYNSLPDHLSHGFLFGGGNLTPLDVPGSTDTIAYGINDSSQIVGTYRDAAGRIHGFLLGGGSYVPIDVPGSSRTDAFGINNSGQIVGEYLDPGGTYFHGFLATPVPPSVNCSVAASVLWPPNHQLVNVGLGVTVAPPDADVHVLVYADDHANRSDAADIGPDTLRLRAERQGNGDGRVYLAVVTATNGDGTSFDVCAVAVPHDHSPRSIAAAQQQAAAAEAYYRENQTAPSGYDLLGEGPDGGSNAPSPGQPGKRAIRGDTFRLASALPATSQSRPGPVSVTAAPVRPADELLGAWAAVAVDNYFATASAEGFRFLVAHPAPAWPDAVSGATLDFLPGDDWLPV